MLDIIAKGRLPDDDRDQRKADDSWADRPAVLCLAIALSRALRCGGAVFRHPRPCLCDESCRCLVMLCRGGVALGGLAYGIRSLAI